MINRVNEIPRRLEPLVEEALQSFRVVLVTGPRQAGKTTLVRRSLGGAGTFARLDRAATLRAALDDPDGFAEYGETPRAFDEVQLAGEPLIRAIKVVVDDDRSRGQFLLNGSADFLTVPTISESLAGRAAFLELWPFSQGELHAMPDGFLATAFSRHESLLEGGLSTLGLPDYLQRICMGGFPEAIRMPAHSRRIWYRDYVRSVTQRDIKDLSGARLVRELPRLLSLTAARTSGELVVSNIAEGTDLGSRNTVEAYLGYLQMAYLVLLLPAWSRSLTAKVTHRPKVHITDSGLAAYLLGKNPESLARPTDAARGSLFESFVFNELSRQVSWLDIDVRLHHFRSRGGAEIDIIAEASDGRIVAVEVKASPVVHRRDFRHLEWLRDKVGDEFVCGVVLNTGQRPYRLGERLFALPLSHLWSTPAF